MMPRRDEAPALSEHVLRGLKRVRYLLRPATSPATVVWVAGVQRSGTNLLMKVLDRALHTDVFHETDPRAFVRYEMRSLATIAALVQASRAPRVVVKSLCELQDMRRLLDTFPESRCLWLWRDPVAVAASMVASFGNFVRQARALAADPASMDWRGLGMSSATRNCLAEAVADDALDERSAAALMWYYRNILFFEQGLHRDPRVRLLRYEDFVHTPFQVLPPVFEFAGIPWHKRCAARLGGSPPSGSTLEGRQALLPKVAMRCAALAAELQAHTPPVAVPN